jgi:hypothetical protein
MDLSTIWHSRNIVEIVILKAKVTFDYRISNLCNKFILLRYVFDIVTLNLDS